LATSARVTGGVSRSRRPRRTAAMRVLLWPDVAHTTPVAAIIAFSLHPNQLGLLALVLGQWLADVAAGRPVGPSQHGRVGAKMIRWTVIADGMVN
jgi:hypothetical protein